jgi:lipopolysaccharide/colanic/teichoic acid biosynthesis glycosyltransferase
MTAVDTDRGEIMKRLISIVSIVVTAIMVCLCLLLIMIITSTFARGTPPILLT